MSSVKAYAQLLECKFHPQLIFPELANEIGLEESIILQQVHYWLERCGKAINNNVWIYNTYDQWKEQFSYWSISKIKRIFYSLEKSGLILSKKMNVDKSNHTKWYSINYDKLFCLVSNKALPVKKFKPIQNELSSSQCDTIIISKTNNNSTKNNLSKDITTSQQGPSYISKVKKHTFTKIRQTDFLIEDKMVCQKMIEAWNDIFINIKQKVVFTRGRGEKLLKVWENTFSKDIEKWKDFCLAVNSSKFLMGEKNSGFKARFDWVICEDTVNRIIAGEFDIGDRVPDIKRAEIEFEARNAKESYISTLEEQRKMKEQDARKLEMERLAESLAYEELKKIEAGWTEQDKEKAKKSFEDFLERGGEESTTFSGISQEFKKNGWHSPLIGYFFNEFKVITYLEKSSADFIKEAEALLSLDSKDNIEEPEINYIAPNKTLDMQKVKIEAERKERLEKENLTNLRFDLEVAAQRLALEEVERLEARWTSLDRKKAIEEFEDFLMRGGDGNPSFKYIIENFRKKGWIEQNAATVDLYFQEFKIITYLKNGWEACRRQVEGLVTAPAAY